MATFWTIVVPGASLPSQAWWATLHTTINQAYIQKHLVAIPPTWKRLDPEPSRGAERLAEELGPRGSLIVIFDADRLVACSGFLPFRGEDWIAGVNDPFTEAAATSGEITTSDLRSTPQAPSGAVDVVEDWEVCCFCTHPDYRGRGLSRLLLETLTATVKGMGAKRLIANYSIEATGNYWSAMGFTQQVGKDNVLRKGFTHTPGMEGLREDLHFRTGARAL